MSVAAGEEAEQGVRRWWWAASGGGSGGTPPGNPGGAPRGGPVGSSAHPESDVLVDVIGSPWGIAFQVAMLAGLVLLLRVDWASLLESRGRRHEAQLGAVGAVQTAAERDEGHRAGEQREPEEDDPVQEDRRRR